MIIFMFLLIRALCHFLLRGGGGLWTPMTPLRRRRHTCAISDLYGVTNVHFKEVRATLLNHAASHLKTLIPTELLNTLMILFLLTEALYT
jgi:hypothetical protein